MKVAAFHSLRLNHSVEASRAYINALVERASALHSGCDTLGGSYENDPATRRYGAYLKKEGRETLLLDALDALAKHGEMAQPVIGLLAYTVT